MWKAGREALQKKTESFGQFLRQELKKMTAFEAEGPKKSLLFNN